MKKALIRFVPAAALISLVVAGAALAPQSANSSSPVKNQFLAHKLAVELGTTPARGKEMPASSGLMYAALEGSGVLSKRVAAWARTAQGRAADHEVQALSQANTEGCQNVFHGHGMTNTR